MRNGCSTLQRTANFACSIFLSQLRPLKSSAILRFEEHLFTQNSVLDFFIVPGCGLVSSSKITGVPIYHLTPDEICGLWNIMHIGRCTSYCMNVSAACIYAGMYFHSEVPFIALLCLMHFRSTWPYRFLVDFGVAIRLASTIVPPCMIRPALSRRLLTSAKIFSPILFVSSICLNLKAGQSHPVPAVHWNLCA